MAVWEWSLRIEQLDTCKSKTTSRQEWRMARGLNMIIWALELQMTGLSELFPVVFKVQAAMLQQVNSKHIELVIGAPITASARNEWFNNTPRRCSALRF